MAVTEAQDVVFPDDEAVMRAVQAGHLDLLGTLFRRHSAKAFALCFRMVGDSSEADDLVQESFLRVLRYRQSFEGKARFSSWLYRIVTNVCLDHLRARSREGEAARALASEEEDFEVRPDAGDERLDLLRTAFERLSPEKRDLLVRARIRGHGYARLAQDLGASEGAVRVRVHRALRELKSIVASLREGGP